jgi:hypothetical protein
MGRRLSRPARRLHIGRRAGDGGGTTGISLARSMNIAISGLTTPGPDAISTPHRGLQSECSQSAVELINNRRRAGQYPPQTNNNPL